MSVFFYSTLLLKIVNMYFVVFLHVQSLLVNVVFYCVAFLFHVTEPRLT